MIQSGQTAYKLKGITMNPQTAPTQTDNSTTQGASSTTGGTTDNGQGTTTPPATTSPEATNVDLTKLSSEQLAEVFKNPGLYEHPRFKELADAKQRLKAFEDEKNANEQKVLEEQGKFKELNDKIQADLQKAQEDNKNLKLDQVLTNKLHAEKVIDLDGALKLIDRSKLSIDDNGNVTGVDEALGSLKTDKAYLFGSDVNNQTTLGSSSNNGDGAGTGAPAKFKRSQLKDPAFFAQHEKEIMEAYSAGLIEDDISGQ